MQRLLLFLLVFVYSCSPTPKKVDQDQAVSEITHDLYDFKSYAHLDSMKISAYIESEAGRQTSLSNPNLFLYRDSQDKIRIALEKEKGWQTWEIFDASNYSYNATIELKNFDNKGIDDLVIISNYGISPQSTMGSEYFSNTEIWDLEQVHQYFTIEHYSYSDDMGRNGDNTFSKEFKLSIQITPQSITVSPETDHSLSLENEQNIKEEDYPIFYRLVNNEVVQVSKE